MTSKLTQSFHCLSIIAGVFSDVTKVICTSKWSTVVKETGRAWVVNPSFVFRPSFTHPPRLLGWPWASPTIASSTAEFLWYIYIYICRYVSYVVCPMHAYVRQMWAICVWSNNTDVLCYLVGARADIWARQLERSHWKVYRARAINIQLCGKAQLTECIEGGRDFVPCWCVTTSLLFPKMPQVRTMHAWVSLFRLSMCIQQPE